MTKSVLEPVSDPDAAMRRVNEGLRRVVSVSKADLAEAMAKEKASREGKPKRGPKPAAEHSR